MNIGALVEWASIRFGERLAFIEGDRSLSFREIDVDSNRVAHVLADMDVHKGDRVALVMENCLEFPVVSFGISKRGAVVVPLLSRSTEAEMTQWLNLADVKVVFVSSTAASLVEAACSALVEAPALVVIGESEKRLTYVDLMRLASPSPAGVDISGDDAFIIRFTGGTTGEPKGVAMSHRNYVALYTNHLLNLPIARDDVALHIHPLSHAAGQLLYGYFAAGATQIIRPAFGLDPVEVLRTVEKRAVTSLFIIPTVLPSLVDAATSSGADTSSLRTILYGGAPMALEHLKQGLSTFGEVFVQMYGSSEAPQVVTALLPFEHRTDSAVSLKRLQSAGRPVLNVEVKVVGENGDVVPSDQVGEVLVRGDNTMVGYWRNEELTRARVRDGWVLTGDLGYFDADGYLFIVDRKDDMIISGGFNVWPTEVEGCLYEHPDVLEAAVFGVQSERWGQAVTAIVVPRDGADVTAAALTEFLVQRLSKYKVPKDIRLSTSPLPKSAVGKMVRRLAREQYLEAPSNGPDLERRRLGP